MIIKQVDLNILLKNFKKIYSLLGNKAMAVLKGDAYSHGMEKCSEVLFDAGCKNFAISNIKDGIFLRKKLGKSIQIIDLCPVNYDSSKNNFYEEYENYEIIPSLISEKQIEEFNKNPSKAGCWIKLNTGMNRFGVEPDFDFKSIKNLRGIMSHLAENEDIPSLRSKNQLKIFQETTANLNVEKSLGKSICLTYNERWWFDYVRIGKGLFYPVSLMNNTIGTEQIAKLYSTVVNVLKIKAGDFVGYNSFLATKNMTVAVCDFGWYHGPKRSDYDIKNLRTGEILFKSGDFNMDYSYFVSSSGDIFPGDEIELLPHGAVVNKYKHGFPATHTEFTATQCECIYLN